MAVISPYTSSSPWFEELRSVLADLGVELPPAPFGTPVTNANWINWATLISNGLVIPEPPIKSKDKALWDKWFTTVENSINT